MLSFLLSYLHMKKKFPSSQLSMVCWNCIYCCSKRICHCSFYIAH